MWNAVLLPLSGGNPDSVLVPIGKHTGRHAGRIQASAVQGVNSMPGWLFTYEYRQLVPPGVHPVLLKSRGEQSGLLDTWDRFIPFVSSNVSNKRASGSLCFCWECVWGNLWVCVGGGEGMLWRIMGFWENHFDPSFFFSVPRRSKAG